MRKWVLITIAAAMSMQLGMAQRGGGGAGRGGGAGGGGGRGGGAAAPQAPAPSGLECFDNLPMPEYPKAALQAKVDGSVWYTVDVGPDGAPGKIDTQVTSSYGIGPKMLQPPADAAIHAAKFKASCAGKSVLVVFRYQLHGDAIANPEVTTRKDPPNMVWIESQPMKAAAAPAAAKAEKKAP